MAAPIIRYATEDDIPAILGMIRELADYEHELAAVEATLATLTQTLALAPRSFATATTPDEAAAATRALVTAERPARTLLLFPAAGAPACGMALFFSSYSTWRSRPGVYLEDLYVQPSTRGKGYGKALLQALAREVVAMDGRRLEWSVLKWNEPSIKFYEKIGATPQTEWQTMRLDREALAKMAEA